MMKALLVMTVLLVPSLAYGGNPPSIDLVAPPAGTGCTPAGSPCPMGAQAPSGYHFDLVYNDDFTHDTAINTSLWNTSSVYPGTIYLDSNGLNLQPTRADSNCYLEPGARACDAGIGSNFSPKFGHWEWSVKYPRGWDGSGDGYHIDTYINDNNSTDRSEYEEIGIGESVLGTSANNYLDFYCCVVGGNGIATVDATVPNNSPVRLSDDFHTIGVLWADDGVGNGVVSSYLDGSALYTGGRQGAGWGSGGAVIIMESVSCYPPSQVYAGGNTCSSSTATSGNPLTYRYFRYWRLLPN